ncbi:MAG: PadR family transcriptional regulator [Methanobacterium sp.]
MNPFKNLHRDFHERIEEMRRFGGLRMWIIHVLDEHGSANGVEIMDAIQAHQEGMEMMSWNRGPRGRHGPPRPSPGSVYPMLKKMVEEDLIIKHEDGKYELTEKAEKIVDKWAGRLRQHKDMDRSALSIRKALTEMDGYVSYLEDLKKDRLTSQKELIGDLSERLKMIEETLHE